MFVRFPGSFSKARQVRECLHRDFVRDLEAELEVGGDLGGEALQIFDARKGVICHVHVDRFENFRVFAQAVSLEPGFGNFASPNVAGFVVKLPAPAGVFCRVNDNAELTG